MSFVEMLSPDEKIDLGSDYINIVKFFENSDAAITAIKRNQFIDEIIRLFLLQWGFTLDEIKTAFAQFWRKQNEDKLDKTIGPVFNRLVDFLQDKKEIQDCFITEMITIAYIDCKLTHEEKESVRYLKEKFNLQDEEFEKLQSNGLELATVIKNLSITYRKFRGKI
jgi:hypothetical protein